MMLCLFIFSGDLPCRFGFIIQVLFHIHFSLGEFWITGRSSQTEYSILLWNKCTHCRTPSEGMYFLWPTEQCLSLDSKLVVSPCHWKTRTFGMLRWHLHANTLQIDFFLTRLRSCVWNVGNLKRNSIMQNLFGDGWLSMEQQGRDWGFAERTSFPSTLDA